MVIVPLMRQELPTCASPHNGSKDFARYGRRKSRRAERHKQNPADRHL